MSDTDSGYSFGYKPQIEDGILSIFVTRKGSDTLLHTIHVDMDEYKALTFKDEDFDGGKETPYTLGDWLEFHGMWVLLSARTSSVKGIAKLDAMESVLKMFKEEKRFRAERQAPSGGGFSYQIQAIANLRSTPDKKVTYQDIATAKRGYKSPQWGKIVKALQPKLDEEIKRLKAEADAASASLDDLLSD